MDAEIMAIAETIKNTVDCEKIYLFGSFAYGEPHKDSDLDFYVVLPDDSNLRPIEAMRKIHRNLSSVKRTMPVDVLAARSSRFAEMSALPTMERQIAREGVMLYEQDGISQRMV
jgi:predicted nucleotidyltransferase